MDINNAFQHGDLNEEVFMEVPEGLDYGLNIVCKLKKSLYVLKQASRQWFAKLTLDLLHQDSVQSNNDKSLFLKKSSQSFIIVAVYVVDIILIGNDIPSIHSLKSHLHFVFSVKDLGLLHFFLGLEVTYTKQGIILSQQKFIRDSRITHFKPVVTSLPINLKLQRSQSNLLSDPSLYQRLVGKLNFLTHTRPDLLYTVQTLSHFMQSPSHDHFSALTHTLNYIASTSDQGILLKGFDHI